MAQFLNILYDSKGGWTDFLKLPPRARSQADSVQVHNGMYNLQVYETDMIIHNLPTINQGSVSPTN